MNTIKLKIKEHESTLAFSTQTISAPIGYTTIDGYTFQNSPITAYEAEVAIEHIENVIIPILHQLPTESLKVSCDDARLQYLLKDKHANFVSITHIESRFNELVNVINGAPISSTTLPTDSSFTAFLLIIREISHHWQLEGIYI